MTSLPENDLERALALFLRFRQDGGDWDRLLADHPDLAETLASFVDAEPQPAPMEPGLVFGDFEVVREIGSGGTGTVYEARQRGLQRRVAVKVLRAEFAAHPVALGRFHREAQALARLDHPGIVRVLATGECDGQPWLAMEFVDGASLAVHLERQRHAGGHHGPGLRRLVEQLAGVAVALEHAHRAGFVHRDVKPSNILLRADGAAVLGDFGLARAADAPSLTQTGVVAGTPHYMAPEMVLGGVAGGDARADVWSLGATLYECMTLQHAFAGGTTEAVLRAVVDGEPVDPRRHRRDLPTDLVAICLKALEREPGRRYATAQAMADDLAAFLELRGVAAAAPTRWRRFVRRLRRQPLLVVVLLLAVASLGLAGGMVWQWPALRAAERLRVDGEVEDLLVSGLLARVADDAVACRERLERAVALAPLRGEPRAIQAVAELHFAGPAAALARLDRCPPAAAATEDVTRCRALLLRRLQRDTEAEELERRLGEPQTPIALWITAVVHSRRSDPQSPREVERLLSLAVRTAPRPRLLLHAEWANAVFVLRDPALSREAADALERLWPDHPVALHSAGANALHFAPTRAVALLQRALARGLRDPFGRFNLGVAHTKAGAPKAAMAEFESVMAGSGISDAMRTRMVDAARQVGEDDAAQRLVAAWLARDPRSVEARRLRARELFRADDTDGAIAMLRACLAETPASVLLRQDLAFSLVGVGEAAEAKGLLQALVQEQPDLEFTHQVLLDACDALQDVDAALAESRRWADRRPRDVAAWSDLAKLLLAREGRELAQDALAAAERADRIADGADPAVTQLRIQALERLGHAVEAARLRARR